MMTDANPHAVLLRKWAAVVDIPSGLFVNEDLAAAADEIDRLAARDAEIAKLREALEQIKRTIGKARNRASAALTAYDIASDILSALASIPEKTPPDEPTEHEAFGANRHGY